MTTSGFAFELAASRAWIASTANQWPDGQVKVEALRTIRSALDEAEAADGAGLWRDAWARVYLTRCFVDWIAINFGMDLSDRLSPEEIAMFKRTKSYGDGEGWFTRGDGSFTYTYEGDR